MLALHLQAPAAAPAPPRYGSCFINDRGDVLWLELQAACPTAFRAAQILSDEDKGAWDRSTPDEINAILIENGIEPAQIALLRTDVVILAARARLLAYREDKKNRERASFR